MSSALTGTILVIAGPTASGKTRLAVELADRVGGEIVGADSVQVYRRLDIGSAKPTPEELRGVTHHLLDVADINEGFDAARYAQLADRAIADAHGRAKPVIVAGGTGLYVRALIWGLAEGIPSDPVIRARLNARAAESPAELARMHEELRGVDPEYAAKIHPTDPIRVVRALEVWEISGEAISAHHARHAAQPPRYQALILGLSAERAGLRTKIAERTREMLERGWIDEVRGVLADGYPHDAKPLRSVGYAEVVRHVRGELARDALDEAVVNATTAFAKRQRTWFRAERGIEWVTPEDALGPAWDERIRRHLEL